MDRYQTSDAGRALAKVILAPGDLGRPIVAPPGVPADRIKILRESFEKTIQHPALLAGRKEEGWKSILPLERKWKRWPRT
jgi:tripartite-type tricarboxylate transporter receptor subunit TctC